MSTVKYQGRDIEVEEVEVLTETERWNEYQLANGSVLSVKSILMKINKAVGEKDLYLISTQNVVKVTTSK